MRAVRIRAFGAPLVVDDVPVPTPGPDEVLVRVQAAGVCATDVKLAEGKTAPPPALPHIPGHEIAGDVVSGSGGLAEGQRVACHIMRACGVCPDCTRGYPILCPTGSRLGLDVAGGMAEYVAVPVAQALPLNAAIPYAQAAVAMDSVTTPWHALHVTGAIVAGETLVIVGVGGLGINAVALAVAAGARVAAIDVDDARLEAARTAGAELAVAPDGAEHVRAWAGGGVDMALELSGHRSGFATAAALVRGGGRVVCCGYAPGVEYGMDSARMVLENIQILGSRNLTLDDSRAALAAVAAGQVTPQISDTLALDDVNQALDRLRAGRAGGRIVLVP